LGELAHRSAPLLATRYYAAILADPGAGDKRVHVPEPDEAPAPDNVGYGC